jgi:hypothetical protein
MSASAVPALNTEPQTPSKKASSLAPTERVPLPWLVVRVLWIAARLILAYWLAWQARPFFYQRF